MLFSYLRGRLRQLDIDQVSLARRMGLKQPTVSNRLTGRTAWTIDEMYQVLEICEAPPEDLHIYFPKGGKSA